MYAIAFAFASSIVAPCSGQAQHAPDDDHHHALVHFSHPLFTESPSPDTKVRLDYLYADLADQLSDNTIRVEAEYAFSRNWSIEVNLPMTSHSENDVRTTAVGSGEIALKLASFASAKHGLLLGGGIGFGVPTGSDRKGIGSGHLVEIEPYLDLGYMHDAIELVSFASWSVSTRRKAGEDQEQQAALAASLMYHVNRCLESLLEMEARHTLAGEDSGNDVINIGAGLKYHIPGNESLVLGLGGRIPITDHREFRHEIIVSALYHF